MLKDDGGGMGGELSRAGRPGFGSQKKDAGLEDGDFGQCITGSSAAN